MYGGLATRIALVAHGNAFLSGLVEDPPDLFAENSVFQYARSVEFRASGRSIHRVDLWFSALARRGARRLWVRSDDLAAEGASLREVWVPSEVFISQQFEERQNRQLRAFAKTGVWDDDEGVAITAVVARTERPWRVHFTQEPRASRFRRGPALPTARVALVEAVTEAREFSRRNRMGFVGSFDKSLASLRSHNPVALYHPDMLPSGGYSLDARRVMAAATQAWVFGPWGWSDSVTGTDSVMQEFWRLDASLRTSVIDAVIAAANSFDGSQNGRRGA
jgi:hypothetical protein